MNNLRTRLGGLLLVICLSAINPLAQAQSQALSLYSPVERELAGAEQQTYTLHLKQGQIAQVVTEQRGIDVAVAGIAPGGQRPVGGGSPARGRGGGRGLCLCEQAGGAIP